MSDVQVFLTHMLSLESVLGFCYGIAKGGDKRVQNTFEHLDLQITT